MYQLINGFEFAKEERRKLKEEIDKMEKKPVLAVILVGENPASQIYVRNKEKACEEVGIKSRVYRIKECLQVELLAIIDQLNKDEDVDGILVQLPLPEGMEEQTVIQAIDPNKDVDGFHPVNLGKLMLGLEGPVACTPKGCLKLIKSVKENLTGLNALVIGRSNIVGKPMAQLLLKENCTVTIAHSKTVNLPELCKQADIVVAAVGKPKFVQKEWVKDGAIVIDVGINRLEDGKLCGDVDFENVAEKCFAITPVPKGVGPMTIAMLLENTLYLHKK
ncbi:MAG: bifunctional methylenetetrahydrofolate dehydrogenase/methenyltetrahydrofolate cyclohydrolase FolD [Alphaproteobacteria bacterium]|nr:bifunctional methylenetetrahydrofolate dehydrogenase/methenyltetrahydrofolate cyclohydrolase FolD [Alphaproteobacteria bacterium]